MKDIYLEVMFRKGKAFAAYLYLPRTPGTRSAHTKEAAPGFLVDYSKADEPIGIEITAPGHISARQINSVLKSIGIASLSSADLAPLRVA